MAFVGNAHVLSNTVTKTGSFKYQMSYACFQDKTSQVNTSSCLANEDVMSCK